MASFTEKIRLIFDVDSNPATKGFGNFAKSIRDADGAAGKLKAGLSGINQAGSAFALAGGAALIGAAVKGASAFTDLAKASIDLSTATGLSTTEASKWIALADDYQVGAEALATGLGKITKTMDDSKWGEYGIAVKDAGGMSRPVNDILLDTLDMLSGITNETDRARIGQELFGKGYQSLTPILGNTRAEYEKMLAATSAGQTVTDEEAAKAERLRLAQDALADALADVTIAFGGVAASAAPAIEVAAKGLGIFATLTGNLTNAPKDTSKAWQEYSTAIERANLGTADAAGYLKDASGAFFDLTTEMLNSRGGFTLVNDLMKGPRESQIPVHFRILKETFRDLAKKSPEQAQAVYDSLELMTSAAERNGGMAKKTADDWGLTSKSLGTLKDMLMPTTKSLKDQADAADEAAKKTMDLYNAVQKLNGINQDAEQALFAFQDALDKINTTTDDAKTSVNEHTQAVADGAIVAENYARKLAAVAGAEEGSIENTRLQVEQLENMVGLVGKDSELGKRLQEYIDTLKSIDGVYTARVNLDLPGGGNTPSGVAHPNGPAQGSTNTVNIHVTTSPLVDPVRVGREISNSLAAYYRSGGARAI